MSQLLINKSIKAEGAFSFSAVLNESVKPPMILYNGILQMDKYLDKENKISTIENSCINLITPVNVKVINFLTSLIGKEIEAYDQYPKLPSIRELDCKEL